MIKQEKNREIKIKYYCRPTEHAGTLGKLLCFCEEYEMKKTGNRYGTSTRTKSVINSNY
jgi:hypothetical protein